MSEHKSVILIEDVGRLDAFDQAKALSAKTGFECHTLNPQKAGHSFKTPQWQLVFTEQALVLRFTAEPSWSDISVDFCSSALAYRKQHGGGRNEAIAKAIGIKSIAHPKVLDCTAGMGTDSFVMASVGAKVTMLERSPHIGALLDDALLRLRQNTENTELSERLKLIQMDAALFLENQAKRFQSESTSLANKGIRTKSECAHSFDVIYLDPMFPHKKKSAAVKKEMQAFQRLLGADTDSEALFSRAIDYMRELTSHQKENTKPKRIVVKRPNSAEELSSEQHLKVSTQIRSKKHRFDVYIFT